MTSQAQTLGIGRSIQRHRGWQANDPVRILALVTILVVGASVAGVRTAQALRLQGYAGPVTLVGEEIHHPYDKPPLSKGMLEADGAPIPLASVDELAAADIGLRLGVRASALDPVRAEVQTAAGETLAYEELVIATGVRPRTLPGVPAPAGVHTIRTADDALALRAALARRPSVVVVGAGFIGSEFASAARAYGCTVSVLEAQEIPMAHLLGAEVGSLLATLHESNGVSVHTGSVVERFDTGGDGRVRAVVLTDGRSVPADLVVVGIGAVPATEWLTSSGLPIADGIECDEGLRVTGFPHIHAAGDVARWPHPFYGVKLRIEHWTNANEHGSIVAADLMGKPMPRVQPPYVWSDQYGHRIQIVGRPGLGSLKSLTGDVESGLVALYADAEGSVVGGLVLDDPRRLMAVRKAIARREPVSVLVS